MTGLSALTRLNLGISILILSDELALSRKVSERHKIAHRLVAMKLREGIIYGIILTNVIQVPIKYKKP